MSLYPKARPLSTRPGSPRQKRPSVGISLLIPFWSIYPHFDPENYPHCPHPYPQDTLISTFLHVDKVVEKACERLPPVLWARDRCGSLPQIMRSGHVAGQRGPSCKIEDDLFSVPLFLFRQRKKAAEKEKLNWGNGNSGRIAYITRLSPSLSAAAASPSPAERKTAPRVLKSPWSGERIEHYDLRIRKMLHQCGQSGHTASGAGTESRGSGTDIFGV